MCGQIDIIRQKLSEIMQKNTERKNIDQSVNESVVKALIVRHQQIITFSQNIETLYSNIALIQFGTNTLVICCLGFLIVIVSTRVNNTTCSKYKILNIFSPSVSRAERLC